jgi:glycerol-3-phosphate dehydrogenase
MERDFSSLSNAVFDMLVIGGGATGAAIAWDACLRGLHVALIDKSDFSAATSAASSKLMHGGLRYLANGEITLVREGLRERRVWGRIAPHLVQPLPFVLPTYKPLMQSKWVMGLGLAAYDLLAFDTNRKIDPAQKMPSRRALTVAQTLGLAPGLARDGLTGGYIYHDGQMLSPERLCLSMIRSAVAGGGVAVNYARADAFAHDASGLHCVTVRDMRSRRKATVRAKTVVNAAGPWADFVMQSASTAPAPKQIMRSKGIHFITRDITNGVAMAIPLEDEHLFVLPWQGCTLFATTDTAFTQDPDTVHPDSDDIAALLKKVQTALPRLGLTRNDIVYAYAGLRPLVADAGDAPGQTYGMSRGAEIVDHADQGGPLGLISALGGKWTTCRRLAQQVVDLAFNYVDQSDPGCRTMSEPLDDAPDGPLAAFLENAQARHSTYAPAQISRLARLYGNRLDAMLEAPASALEDTLTGALAPHLAAQVSYAVSQEMAVCLDDVVLRRVCDGQTGGLDDSQIGAIAAYMTARLGWSSAEKSRQIKNLNLALNIA